MIDAAITPKYEKIRLLDATGPVAAIRATADEADRELAAKLTATYGKTEPGQTYKVQVGERVYEVEPYESKAECQKYFIR